MGVEKISLKLLVAGIACALLAGCAGATQTSKESEGPYHVGLVRATFPPDQRLAQPSQLVITVRNQDSKTVPNIAVTVRSFDRRIQDPNLADPRRPIFVVNQPPVGSQTAYVDTYALGPLKPGESKTFTWQVTAVAQGPYRLAYQVAASLDGKAKAVGPDGRQPSGAFTGDVSDAPPSAVIGPDNSSIQHGR